MSKNRCRKLKYKTWQEAELALIKIKIDRKGRRPEKRWYWHDDCKSYHLTSQER